MKPKQALALTRKKKQADKLFEKQRLSEAKQAYQEVCRLDPSDHAAWLNLGAAAALTGDHQTAEWAWLQALSLQPDLPQAHHNLGKLYSFTGRWDKAGRHYSAYLKSNPHDMEALASLALLLEGRGNLVDAAQRYREVLHLQPDHGPACVGLGRILCNQGEMDEAIRWLDKAVADHPELAMAHFEKSQWLRHEARYRESETALERFHELAPRELETYFLSRATLYGEQELYDKTLECYDTGLKDYPRSAQLHWGRALTLLSLGRYEEGWPEFEWRRAFPDWRRQMAAYADLEPQWRGESLAGKRLLVYAEQGYGDTLQFCRYLPQLVKQGASVEFYCPEPLVELMRFNFPEIEVKQQMLQERPALGFDFCLPVMSTAGCLDAKLNDAAACVPYLGVDARRIADWRDRLDGEGLKVGLVWRGSGRHPLDRRRSIPLQAFAPVLAVQGLSLFSLQMEAAPEELEQFPALVDVGGQIEDFADSAAILANLDLVITVDTALAHLAAAMGRPVWVMTYAGPDWRWSSTHDGRVWYPEVRLFRQAPGESWQPALTRLAAELAKYVQTA
jgi:tetratricopeptide (TPR) repeat protein